MMDQKHIIRLTKTQKELLEAMRQGKRLWSFSDGSFELAGRAFWPKQRRTVNKLLDAGLIVFDSKENDVQRRCGMATLGLAT